MNDEQDPDSPSFEVTVDGGRAWHVTSEFAEYDATHAVAGALLAGADEVTVSRTDVEPGTLSVDPDDLSREDVERIADRVADVIGDDVARRQGGR